MVPCLETFRVFTSVGYTDGPPGINRKKYRGEESSSGALEKVTASVFERIDTRRSWNEGLRLIENVRHVFM